MSAEETLRWVIHQHHETGYHCSCYYGRDRTQWAEYDYAKHLWSELAAAGLLVADEPKIEEHAVAHLAWLMWCFSEGYVKASDREILKDGNWLLHDPATLSESDAELRADLLATAQEILAALAGSGRVVVKAREPGVVRATVYDHRDLTVEEDTL